MLCWSLNLCTQTHKSSDWQTRNFPSWIVIRITPSDISSSNLRINYNSVTKDLDILIAPSPIHNIHHGWIYQTVSSFCFSGQAHPCGERQFGNGGWNKWVMHVFCSIFLANSMQERTVSTGAYSGSNREPDFSVTPEFSQLPGLVIESGWSESLSRLRLDKDIWINGCGDNAMLIKWTSLSGGRVSGLIEVWAGDVMANDDLVQTELIANPPGILLMKFANDCYRPSPLPL